MFSLEYAYLGSILGFGILYLSIFCLRKDVRKKMLTLSVRGMIVGPISQYWYLKDYWRPEYILGKFGIVEDLLFAFLIIGFTGGVVNFLTRAKSCKIEGLFNSRRRYRVPALILVGSLLFFSTFLGLNSIYASGIGFSIIAALMWRQRPDLIRFSLVGAVIWITLIIIMYNLILIVWPNLIEQWWMWENISGIKILRIPIEEFLWFGTWGLCGSILYEWRHGHGFRSISLSDRQRKT